MAASFHAGQSISHDSMMSNAIEKDPSPAPKSGWFAAGHYFVWFGAAAIVYISDELDRVFKLWILLIPLLAIPALVALCTFVGGVIVNVWTRQWRRLIPVLAAPILAIGLLTTALRSGINADWIRFHLTRFHYAELARNLPGPSPKYGEWSWGETGGAMAPNIFYSLVYDETDKPLDRPVKPGHEGAELSAQSYGHHFFLVTELYQ